eukprot:TRINITY_DN88091_c1_g1_i1.p1 TRINITY_DN88091_c1_g1~~TRINITY_DN88091_c1_g1_i1.p1  ORF type:complete len:745 (+),score=77.46 TRINITY_DN88091_c1_g1_i1:5489-7723(+)
MKRRRRISLYYLLGTIQKSYSKPSYNYQREYFLLVNHEQEGLMDYLCDSYNRIMEEGRGIPKFELEKLQQIVADKSLKVFMEPLDYYTSNDSPISDCFLMLKNQGPTISAGFFTELLAKLLSVPEGKTMFDNLVKLIHKSLLETLAKLKPEDEFPKWSEAMGVILALVHNKESAKVFMQAELDALNVLAPFIEYSTVLGNMFRYSFMPTNTKYAMNYFQNNAVPTFSKAESLRRTRESLTTSIEIMQDRTKMIITKLYNEHRLKEVLQWFKIVANKNADRQKMMHGPNVSSTGFIWNAFVAILSICHQYSKDYEEYMGLCKLVDSRVCEKGGLDYHRCERINKGAMGKTEEEEKMEIGDDELSQTFFLAHYYMDLCFRELYETINRLWLQYDRTKNNDLLNVIFSFYIHMFSPQFMLLLADFLSFSTCTLMVKIKPVECSFRDYLLNEYNSGFPKDPPKQLASMPEHVVSNIHQAFDFYLVNPEDNLFKFGSVLLSLLCKLYITFLIMPYMTNLHLRGKLTEFFGRLIEERERINSRDLIFGIEEDNVFKAHAVEMIIKAFAFVEKTGANTQFYDKFQYRKYLLDTLQYIWKKPETKVQWKEVWGKDKENSLLFANFLLNDFTHVHNEIISKLKEIKGLEESLAADEMSHTMSPEERQEREAQYQQDEKYVKVFINLLNLMMNTIAELTKITPEIYTSEDLIENFANSLNYYLKHLILKEPLIRVRFVCQQHQLIEPKSGNIRL